MVSRGLRVSPPRLLLVGAIVAPATPTRTPDSCASACPASELCVYLSQRKRRRLNFEPVTQELHPPKRGSSTQFGRRNDDARKIHLGDVSIDCPCRLGAVWQGGHDKAGDGSIRYGRTDLEPERRSDSCDQTAS